jgi:hypothetical protein
VQKADRKVQPLIVDVVDSHDLYKKQWLKRRVYYKKCAYKMETEVVVKEDEEVIPVSSGPLGCLIQDD